MKLLLLALVVPLGLMGADTAISGVLGEWDCVAVNAAGTRSAWRLTVKQDGEKLSATLRAADGYTFDLLDPKYEEGHFSFGFKVNEKESIEVLLKVDGDRMDGHYGGVTSGAGVFKAVRPSAIDVSGTWTGEWQTGPDGKPGPHYMALKQEGAVVTGTAGPAADRQLPIANGRLAGGRLTFDLPIPYGPRIAFEFAISGDAMSGRAVVTDAGRERRLELSAKRVSRQAPDNDRQ